MSQRSVTLKPELVLVQLKGGSAKTVHRHTCSEMEVPLDEHGFPLVQRVELDKHNNLRIYVSPTEFVIFHNEEWSTVKVEESRIHSVAGNA